MIPVYRKIALHAEAVTDIERLRIATANRIAAAEREGIDIGDGLAHQLVALEKIEHVERLELARVIRKTPAAGWVKSTVGIGEIQAGRLLGAIGDPTWNHAEDRPRRGPAELWAYCGYAPGQQRRKGVKSNWNAQAKMRAYLVAESCMKQRRSPYRATYERARENWADRDVKDGHKHNHALRLTAKEILKDLFLYLRAQETQA